MTAAVGGVRWAGEGGLAAVEAWDVVVSALVVPAVAACNAIGVAIGVYVQEVEQYQAALGKELTDDALAITVGVVVEAATVGAVVLLGAALAGIAGEAAAGLEGSVTSTLGSVGLGSLGPAVAGFAEGAASVVSGSAVSVLDDVATAGFTALITHEPFSLPGSVVVDALAGAVGGLAGAGGRDVDPVDQPPAGEAGGAGVPVPGVADPGAADAKKSGTRRGRAPVSPGSRHGALRGGYSLRSQRLPVP